MIDVNKLGLYVQNNVQQFGKLDIFLFIDLENFAHQKIGLNILPSSIELFGDDLYLLVLLLIQYRISNRH